MRRADEKARSGQVVVEMLLILPIFFTMIFTIMEIGYVSFQLIVLNHATYEVARIGGMSATPSGNVSGCDEIMKQVILSASATCFPEPTLMDPQSGQQSFDLIVRGTNKIRLVFPISSLILADPAGSGMKELQAVVRMPIEMPLKK